MMSLSDRLQKVSDQLLELLVPKATAEAQPGQWCRPLRDCPADRNLVLYWDVVKDTSCGCWYR
jgi:hypothetical protein